LLIPGVNIPETGHFPKRMVSPITLQEPCHSENFNKIIQIDVSMDASCWVTLGKVGKTYPAISAAQG